jgi:hypothetical protein
MHMYRQYTSEVSLTFRQLAFSLASTSNALKHQDKMPSLRIGSTVALAQRTGGREANMLPKSDFA